MNDLTPSDFIDNLLEEIKECEENIEHHEDCIDELEKSLSFKKAFLAGVQKGRELEKDVAMGAWRKSTGAAAWGSITAEPQAEIPAEIKQEHSHKVVEAKPLKPRLNNSCNAVDIFKILADKRGEYVSLTELSNMLLAPKNKIDGILRYKIRKKFPGLHYGLQPNKGASYLLNKVVK